MSTALVLDHGGIPVRRKPANRMLRARYDAAQTVTDSRRHWASADDYSASAANSVQVRHTLRKRSRYEAANNPVLKGIVLTLANDCIGTGPRLQVRTENEALNTAIETKFMQWTRKVRFAEKLRIARISKAIDGEVFIRFITNDKLGEVSLDLQVIEADQITSPFTNQVNPLEVDGIEFDAAGNPVAYLMLQAHPGDTFASATIRPQDVMRIPASQMIHLQRQDRPGLARSVPEITPALGLFAERRRFREATIRAAETAADFAGVLFSKAPTPKEEELDENETNFPAFDTVEIEKGMLMTVPAGYEMNQMRPEHPSTTYEMFDKQLLKELGRCLNMPYNVVAGDSSEYNYASGRLDHQVYFKAIRVERSYFDLAACDRTLEAWMFEASRIPQYLPARVNSLDELTHQWHWDGNPHVDPAKEATARETRLRSRTTTYAREYQEEGLDWETEFRQEARERALRKELGLPLLDETPEATTARRQSESMIDTAIEEEDEVLQDA